MAQMTIGKVIARSALSKYATRLYPFEKREPYAATRGHVVIDINTCIFCSICAKKCPCDAIAVDKTAKTWAIDRMKCIQCGACVEACPKKCLCMDQQYSPASATKGIDSFRLEAKTPATEAQQ
jgi:formate hydrogenlyase subunit 6/NADH:ubiquinone oxidoreductase subunit I